MCMLHCLNLRAVTTEHFVTLGGLEQSQPCKEAAGESQRGDAAPEEDSWVCAT